MDKFGSNAYLYLDKKQYTKFKIKFFFLGIIITVIIHGVVYYAMH